MHSRYIDWLKYVFDRPATANGWYFDEDELEPFEAEQSELAELVACTFENCARDLSSYSNDQLRFGLSYILENVASDVVFSLMSEDVPTDLRLRAIGSLKHVYSEIFERRCAPVLGHISEPGGNALNYICYMLWDVSPLSCWERSQNRAVFYSAVCDVLENSLRSSNRACVESGLHGLGHVFFYYPERAERIVDGFLLNADTRAPELRQYAQAARMGHVQ